jgi:WD40 repeat protein/transcriptional regulator with XRE-family HTH domain
MKAILMEKQSAWYQILRHERILRGWGQAYVAEQIGSDIKTVARWEAGKSFPSTYFRPKLIELYGKNAIDLGLVKDTHLSDSMVMIEAKRPFENTNSGKPVKNDTRKEDWGQAPHIDNFYGHAKELTEIEQWIIDEHCRIVAILGIGGIGKTTFATKVAMSVKNKFDIIFWYSLKNAPPVENTLGRCIQFITGQQQNDLPQRMDEQISLLITLLQERRCLIVLDNVESILQPGNRTGLYLDTHEGYGLLFNRIGESYHQSCLLLTSREKPKEIARMEGTLSPVRSFPVRGMQPADGQELLQDKGIWGQDTAWTRLVDTYLGNPLALKLVSEPIREVFGGDIANFLKEEEMVFGDIHDFLDQQFQRLSRMEQEIMYWLAIEREGISLNTLREDMLPHVSKGALIETLDALRRRCMMEVNGEGHFMLQPVIQEYVARRFVEQIFVEIDTEHIGLLGSHALIKAEVSDYVRNSQVRFILTPLAEMLLNRFGKVESENKLKHILVLLKKLSQTSSYGAGNILNLLIQFQADLRGYDFSRLSVRQAYIQGIPLPEVNFAHCDLTTSVFTDTFSSIQCVLVSPNGALLAAGTTTDEVRFWQVEDATSLFICSGHTDGIRSIAFSPDSTLLASGSEDQTVRLWDTRTGICLNTLRGHTNWIRCVTFSPDGHTLASAGEDLAVRLWDTRTGRCFRVLQENTASVRSIAFNADGTVLASGGNDFTIRLWDIASGNCLKQLEGHTKQVRSITFSPDGKLLASGSEDHSIRIWESDTGKCLNILQGHTSRVRAVAFSFEGTLLASCSDDQTVRLWDTRAWICLNMLQGHTNRIWSIAFVPGGKTLISASEDDTMRFWEVSSGLCIRTLQGQTSLIKSVAFHPTGEMIASGSEDQMIRLWNVMDGKCLHILHGHSNRVRCVSFSPNGAMLASSSEDETVRIWDTHTGNCLMTLHGHSNLVRSVAFSPDGSSIASASHDQTIRIWNARTGHCLKTIACSSLPWSVAFSPDGTTLATANDDHTVSLWNISTGDCILTLKGHSHRVWSVAFHPNGACLASSGDDSTIRVWDSSTGECLKILEGHSTWTRCIAFSPDGHFIASGSHDQTGRIWDVRTGQCLTILRGHRNCIWSVAFSANSGTLITGSDDGTIKLWRTETGECLKTLRSERLYERLNIAHVKGLTEAQKTSLKALGAIEEEQ